MTSSQLAHALTMHLGPDVRVAFETVSDASELFDTEKTAVARAIPKRQAEFAAGRRAARAALAQLDQAAVAIPAGADRAPLWPNGLVGSITHDQGFALAVVAHARSVRAVGVDLTQAQDLPGTTRNAILKSAQEQKLHGLEARAVFSAKECIFKALYPDVKAFFGFDAASVFPNLQENSFTAELLKDLGPYPKGTAFKGPVLCEKGCLTTALVLPR